MTTALSAWLPKAAAALGWVLGALLLLTGCDQAIEVPEPAHTPRIALALTIDNLAPTDSLNRRLFVTRAAFVSVSQRLYDLRQLQGRTDATLEVSDAGGAVVERYRSIAPPANNPYYYQVGQYRPTLGYRFRPGQDYTVRVAVPGVETATSSLTLPAEVPVQVTFTPLNAGTSGQDRARVTVSFDEPAGSRDYYLATAQIVDQRGNPVGYINVEEDETGVDITSLRLSSGGSYGARPFSDATVNGQRVNFSNNVEYFRNGNSRDPRYLQVTLTHLTPDLFQFLNSERIYQDNDGNPFAEPTPLYSNLKPGFGIFGGATDTRMLVPL